MQIFKAKPVVGPHLIALSTVNGRSYSDPPPLPSTLLDVVPTNTLTSISQQGLLKPGLDGSKLENTATARGGGGTPTGLLRGRDIMEKFLRSISVHV